MTSVTQADAGQYAPAVERTKHGINRPATNKIAGVAGVCLALLSLVCLGGAVWTADRMGELDRMIALIRESPDYIMFSAMDHVYYPSVSGYLGVVFTGPAGAIFPSALGLCTCLGLASLWAARRSRPSLLNRALPLVAVLLLPILTLDYMIFSVIEFMSAHWMPHVLQGHTSWLQVWVVVALGCAAVMSLTADALLLRWSWRRELRLARVWAEPAAE